MANEKLELPDQEDNPFGEASDEEEDGLNAAREAAAKLFEDEDDDGGLDSSEMEEGETSTRVSEDEGRRKVDDAQFKKPKAEPEDDLPETKDEDDEKAARAEGDDTATDKTEDDQPAERSVTDILSSMPEADRKAVSARIAEADRLLAPLQTDEAKRELAMHGVNAEQAVSRLVELNRFATNHTDEYIAWVAKQLGGENPAEMLGKAAERYGMKLVSATEGEADDDDPFADETTKQLKRENAELKRRLEQPQDFGPDTPERRAAREAQTQRQEAANQLTAFAAETDETGQLKRPHFETLQGRITELARHHIQSTGQPATIADIDRFYGQAVDEARNIAGVSPAARREKSVQDRAKEQAAAADKARRASTSIDGTGQGASRRPGPADDADVADVIRHFAGY